MTGRKPKVSLTDILESIEYIESYIEGIQEHEFYNDSEKQDAVLRRLEIIGEAVKNLPDEMKNQNDSIPWRKIAGMRDIIIHQYFGVTLSMIWEVTQRELPDLKIRIQKLLTRY